MTAYNLHHQKIAKLVVMIYEFYLRVLCIPLFKWISPVALVSAVIQATILSQRWKRIPRRPLMPWRHTLHGAVVGAAGTPTVRMSKPLSSTGFTDTRCTSWTKAKNVIRDYFYKITLNKSNYFTTTTSKWMLVGINTRTFLLKFSTLQWPMVFKSILLEFNLQFLTKVTLKKTYQNYCCQIIALM